MREGCRRVEAPSGNGLDGRSVGGRRIPERFTIALPPARDVILLLTILSYFEARGPAAGRGVGVTRPAIQAMTSGTDHSKSRAHFGATAPGGINSRAAPNTKPGA